MDYSGKLWLLQTENAFISSLFCQNVKDLSSQREQMREIWVFLVALVYSWSVIVICPFVYSRLLKWKWILSKSTQLQYCLYSVVSEGGNSNIFKKYFNVLWPQGKEFGFHNGDEVCWRKKKNVLTFGSNVRRESHPKQREILCNGLDVSPADSDQYVLSNPHQSTKRTRRMMNNKWRMKKKKLWDVAGLGSSSILSFYCRLF